MIDIQIHFGGVLKADPAGHYIVFANENHLQMVVVGDLLPSETYHAFAADGQMRLLKEDDLVSDDGIKRTSFIFQKPKGVHMLGAEVIFPKE